MGIEPSVTVAIQIGRLPTLAIMDHAMHRPGAGAPPYIPSPILGHHALPWPVRALIARVHAPIVYENGIRPIGRLFEVDSQTGHALCNRYETRGESTTGYEKFISPCVNLGRQGSAPAILILRAFKWGQRWISIDPVPAQPSIFTQLARVRANY